MGISALSFALVTCSILSTSDAVEAGRFSVVRDDEVHKDASAAYDVGKEGLRSAAKVDEECNFRRAPGTPKLGKTSKYMTLRYHCPPNHSKVEIFKLRESLGIAKFPAFFLNF